MRNGRENAQIVIETAAVIAAELFLTSFAPFCGQQDGRTLDECNQKRAKEAKFLRVLTFLAFEWIKKHETFITKVCLLTDYDYAHTSVFKASPQ